MEILTALVHKLLCDPSLSSLLNLATPWERERALFWILLCSYIGWRSGWQRALLISASGVFSLSTPKAQGKPTQAFIQSTIFIQGEATAALGTDCAQLATHFKQMEHLIKRIHCLWNDSDQDDSYCDDQHGNADNTDDDHMMMWSSMVSVRFTRTGCLRSCCSHSRPVLSPLTQTRQNKNDPWKQGVYAALNYRRQGLLSCPHFCASSSTKASQQAPQGLCCLDESLSLLARLSPHSSAFGVQHFPCSCLSVCHFSLSCLPALTLSLCLQAGIAALALFLWGPHRFRAR